MTSLPAPTIGIYWLLDCSGSMTGDKLASLNASVAESVVSLRALARQHPQAWVRVRCMAFSDTAEWLTPTMQAIEDMTWPGVFAGGVTNTGEALLKLADEEGVAVDATVVVLVTDGMPTKPSEYARALEVLETRAWWRHATRLVMPIGSDVDRDSLDRFAGRATGGSAGTLEASDPVRLTTDLRAAIEPIIRRTVTGQVRALVAAGPAEAPELADIGILPLSVFD